MKPNYLDLLKKTLTYSLWPEPAMPVEHFQYMAPKLSRPFISGVVKLLDRFNLQLCYKRKIKSEDRETGKVWPLYADTMIGNKRLDALHYCLSDIGSIEGDFIETGVWRGGASIFMAAFNKYHELNKKVFVADSFCGLPKPTHAEDEGDTHHTHPFLTVPLHQVKNNFRRYGLLDDNVIFIEGWFKDTLPEAPINKLSLIRLDGDMYGSTMDALSILYPKLSPGGYVLVDDYGLPGCRKAIDDYRKWQGIVNPMTPIDWTGMYWRK